MNVFFGFLTALPAWFVFACALTQLGRLCFAAARYVFKDEIEEGVFAFGLGAALFASAVWVLGVFAVLRPWPLGLLTTFVLGTLLVTLRSFVLWGTRFTRALKTLLSASNGFERALLWLAALSLAVTMLAIASPQLGRDALAYHFYCPKQFIQQGAVGPVPYSVNALQPLLVQMLYLHGLMFNSEAFAKLYNLAFALLTALLAGNVARTVSSGSKVPAAAAFLCLAPGWMAQTAYAYTDIALSFLLFLSFAALCRYFEERRLSLAACSALFAGFALATKLLAVPVVAALFFLLLWDSVSRRAGWRPLLVFTLVALAPCAGWYLRSWAATGNPIFPYFHHWFTGREWASDIRDQTGIGRGIVSLIKAPFLFFTDPRPFGGGDSQPGLLPLLLAPLFASLPLKKGYGGKLAFLAAFQFFFWFYLVQHFRFLFPLYPVIALASGLALEELGRRSERWLPYKALIVAAILLQSALILYYNGKLSRYWLFPSREAYLTATERSYASAVWANAHLPKDAYLLLSNEPSQYYFDVRTAREDVVVGLEPELRGKSAKALLPVMKEKGFTHLLVKSSGELPGSALAAAGASGRFKLLHEENFFYGREVCSLRLYELPDA